jgi:hypothetical protein
LKAATPVVVVSRNAVDRWGRIDSAKLHEVNREELDRIRLKISTQGVESLSQQEISFLDRFSENL